MRMGDRFYLLKPLLVTLTLLFIGLIYWHGAVDQLTLVNTRMKATDQSAYMNYARQMVESDYTFIGGRNRMPLYPYLQSLFYDPAMSDEDFFTQGKYVNLILSVGLLVGVALIFLRSFNWLLALNLILITTFTVFIFKAGFFQAELLFYFLNFCFFLLMWRMLTNPSWFVAVLTGVVAALAHLTKASILPGLVIFIASLVFSWLRQIFQQASPHETALTGRKAITYQPVLAFLVVISFLVTTFPYLQTSKMLFGHYFYNVNSTFYLWYDTWEEAKAGTASHGDRIGWPDMPADEIPSMSKYLGEHTVYQIFDRFYNGAVLITSKAAYSYGYFKYVIFYGGLLIVTMLKNRSRAIRLIRSNLPLSLFLTLYFPAYFLLYAWYSPMVDGNNRLILAQFLPLMFTISVGLDRMLSGKRMTISSYQFDTLTLINIGVFIVLLFNILFILTSRINTMYGGF